MARIITVYDGIGIWLLFLKSVVVGYDCIYTMFFSIFNFVNTSHTIIYSNN